MRCRPLSAQLAVLSACHSGSGRAAAGEGVVGLARALLGAGVPTVVVALWELPDEQTSSLMGHFYDRLTASERVDVGEAMREAMLRTRADVVADAGLAIAGLTESHWSGLMVLGCGTVSLGVATPSVAVVPEGVPPQPEPGPVQEPRTEPQRQPQSKMESRQEPESVPRKWNSFVAGDAVVIQGLRNKAEVNGRRAVVQGFDSVHGRYIVLIDGDSKPAKIKPANLQPWPEPEP